MGRCHVKWGGGGGGGGGGVQYIGRISSMIHVGNIVSTLEDVQYISRIS